MNDEIRARLAALGSEPTMEMFGGTNALFAELQPDLPETIQIVRDCAYGPDERHRLDIFAMPEAANAPVLVFVPGGGFIRGDKNSPNSPYFENIGAFAARSGMIGVTMNYRLAPAHRWPSGTDDIASAVDWLRANIAAYGGDPERIYLMGTSAGGAHVAGYVAQREARIAGAIMVSGIYDMVSLGRSPMHDAYFTEDLDTYGKAGCVDGMIASPVPQMFTVSEFDPVHFHRQAALLAAAWTSSRNAFPRMHWLRGHNHQSPTVSIGSSSDSLGPKILEFIADTAS